MFLVLNRYLWEFVGLVELRDGIRSHIVAHLLFRLYGSLHQPLTGDTTTQLITYRKHDSVQHTLIQPPAEPVVWNLSIKNVNELIMKSCSELRWKSQIQISSGETNVIKMFQTLKTNYKQTPQTEIIH